MRFLIPLLLVCACASSPSAMVDDLAPPVPGQLTLAATPMVLGEQVTITMQGAAANANVFLGYSFNGPGTGPCLPAFAGDCLGLANPVRLLGTFRADGNGEVSTTVRLPPMMPVDEIHMQAAVLVGSPDLSNVLAASFFAPGDDADADGLSNLEELDIGTDLMAEDSDGGGATDGEEVDLGIDPLDAGDDVTVGLQGFTATLDLDLVFSGALAGPACTFAGVCDCSASYVSTGVRDSQEGLRVIFTGNWELATTDCSAAVTLDEFIWVPGGSTPVFHSLTFGPGASSLVSWVAHLDPANYEPIADQQVAAMSEQAPVEMNVPWDGSSTVNFVNTTSTTELGVIVDATASSTVTFN